MSTQGTTSRTSGWFHGLRDPEDTITAAIDRAVEHRWDRARQVAESTTGSTDEQVEQVARALSRELAMVGAAAGAAGAVPGAGAATFVGTTVAELNWFTVRAADLVLTIAAVHGHTHPSVAERRSWVLSVLVFGDSAPEGFRQLAGSAARRAAARIPTASLRAVNRRLCALLVTKYGCRRGAVALCRTLPFGVGAVVGGGANYTAVRAIARHADHFFRTASPALVPGSGAAG